LHRIVSYPGYILELALHCCYIYVSLVLGHKLLLYKIQKSAGHFCYLSGQWKDHFWDNIP